MYISEREREMIAYSSSDCQPHHSTLIHTVHWNSIIKRLYQYSFFQWPQIKLSTAFWDVTQTPQKGLNQKKSNSFHNQPVNRRKK